MDAIRLELTHAARRLLRSPTFTAATLTTLALAIGANVAIFTLVNRVVLNPLPYPDSDRLIDLDHAAPGMNANSGVQSTLGLYYHYRDNARTLESVALYDTTEITLTGNGEPTRIRIGRATESLERVLRVPPAVGRWFQVALVSLTLGMVGIYAAVSYIVSQRTNEIGIRLALGAQPGGVAAMIVRQGAVVALAGSAVGLGAALAGSRVIESLLYEVSPRDPVVLATTMVALMAIALTACWLPARRASRVSPLQAMRAE
jgi:putative ABC transport system permease protein